MESLSEEKFDRTKTIAANFPTILRPDDKEVDMLNCKIDVEN